MKRSWLKAASWSVVVEINRQLCAQKQAQHGPTRDGYATTQRLWSEKHLQSLELNEVAELCHRCHGLAPFLNYIGNTFVAIARQVVASLSLPPAEAATLRSLMGHVVAGTALPPEHDEFLRMLRNLAERER
jgi:hypothetical protein